MPELRMRRYDSMNWVVERHVASRKVWVGGKEVQAKAKWVILGYYNRPEHAVMGLLRDVMPDGPFGGHEEVLEAIAEAEARLLAALGGWKGGKSSLRVESLSEVT